MATFEDRVEEVLGLLHGMAWPLLEDSEKRKVIAKVSVGIDKGDTPTQWGRALGCSRQTVGRWVDHYRRSEPIDDVRATAETQRKRISHARSVARENPDAILQDAASRRAILGAITEGVRDDRDLRTGSPNGTKPPASVEIVGDFAALRSATVRTVTKLGTVRLSGMLREQVEAELDRIDAAIGMARDLVTDRKAADWDEALADLMAGGNG